ncbi:PucR family transcriptional regulator [Mycolicibacterium sp. YH-1]|uniref:PucR family transcriptional regulator n=1 Tax=Mycolicibacterium sp. YH-1 TaxID=2908837 RepID=UPI001F4BD597|nr:PucR family transcriptional regulator [Mycolicibacterium sp. YH-1]UNB54460.1 PucR family transcriptional regulator ligand-binding domain-containing protein [Mycolicibacterium sp. YH-1]
MSNLTVGDLIAMRPLVCTSLAGEAGHSNTVVWAHVCELPEPWNWIGIDELLLTTGMCIPSAAHDQRMLIKRLADRGSAGIAIGDDLQAPPLHQDMFAEADRLGFPIISVRHSTPFSAIGRTVAVAAHSDQVSRIARLSKLYETTRCTPWGEESLLDHLSRELGVELHVVDITVPSEVLERRSRLAGAAISRISEAVGGRWERLPARLPVVRDGKLIATGFALSTHRKCLLVAEGPGEVDIDAFVLLHAQSLVAVEVERVTRVRERSDEVEALILQQIVDGTLALDAAMLRLEQTGLAEQNWAVLSFDAKLLTSVRLIVGDRSVPKLSAVIGEEGYLLIADGNFEIVTASLRDHVPAIGVSARTSAIARIGDCLRQARWALHAARADGSGFSEYSSAAPFFLPRTLAEAHIAARAILGELIDYDRDNQSHLIETLEAYLTLDRSWSDTSSRLLIHRQTLAYRLKKIEFLTGRTTRSSVDITAFWNALGALRISRG